MRGQRLACAVVLATALAGCRKEPEQDRLDGEFSADHPELGTWKVKPVSCESGQAYGFQGVLFRFALPPAPPAPAEAAAQPAPPPNTPTTPPEEIRIDVAREGDNVVELRYPDRAGTTRRYRERECASMTGNITQAAVNDNVGPRFRLTGELTISCPAFKLEGHATFAGCLPPRK
jgi:hypothetical protein